MGEKMDVEDVNQWREVVVPWEGPLSRSKGEKSRFLGRCQEENSTGERFLSDKIENGNVAFCYLSVGARSGEGAVCCAKAGVGAVCCASAEFLMSLLVLFEFVRAWPRDLLWTLPFTAELIDGNLKSERKNGNVIFASGRSGSAR